MEEGGTLLRGGMILRRWSCVSATAVQLVDLSRNDKILAAEMGREEARRASERQEEATVGR